MTAQLLAWSLFLRGRARFANSDEIPQILVTDLLEAAFLMGVSALLQGTLLPPGTAAVSGAVALTLHLLSRCLYRGFIAWKRRPAAHRSRRTIVMGAGCGGTQAISVMQQDQNYAFTPVAILDDDPAKRHLRISGVRVLGPWRALGQVAKERRADLVLLAVPSAPPEKVDELVDLSNDLGLEFRVMPSTQELVGRTPARRPATSRDRSIHLFRTTIVFHTAAPKHLTLTERFPEEAFLTNVAATRDLLLAAASHEVQRFINISTDNAADPQCVLGFSKRVAERLTSTIGRTLAPKRRFISVRFGNVLVLDMGKPHNVEEVARRFAALMGYTDPEVTYTHVRAGEKLSENLLGSGEADLRPNHPLISQTRVPPLPMDAVEAIPGLRERARWGQHGALVRRWMEAASNA